MKSLTLTLLLFGLIACGEDPITPARDATSDLTDTTAAPDTSVRDTALDDTGSTDTGTADSGVADTGSADKEPDTTPPLDPVPARYLTGLHSPITPYVQDRLADLVGGAGLNTSAFAKVGDSITVSTQFLNCFAGSSANLDSFSALEPTRQHFSAFWDRSSSAAVIGKTAWWATDGSPSPLEQELSAINPAFAVVMYGTNDIGWFGDEHDRTARWYGEHMITLVDAILARGTLPILTSIPPYDADPRFSRWATTFGAMARALAQARQVPFIDYHSAMEPLPSHGLSGDGVHPNAFSGGACVLTPEGLAFGYNQRNRVTLQALDRVLDATVRATAAPDPPGDVLLGEGSSAAPWEIDAFPFVHSANTLDSPNDTLDTYTGCTTTNEAGPEYIYRWRIASTTRFRALVFDAAGVDIDLHLLDENGDAAGCIRRDNTVISGTLQPGTYHFALDTFVSSSNGEQSGEYFFVLVPCAADDAACSGFLP